MAVAVAERFRQEATVSCPKDVRGGVKIESCTLVWFRWIGCSVSIVNVREKGQADRKADRCPGEEEFVRRWEHFELVGPLVAGWGYRVLMG